MHRLGLIMHRWKILVIVCILHVIFVLIILHDVYHRCICRMLAASIVLAYGVELLLVVDVV